MNSVLVEIVCDLIAKMNSQEREQLIVSSPAIDEMLKRDYWAGSVDALTTVAQFIDRLRIEAKKERDVS